MSNFFNELKRRNVFKETIAYLVVAWLVLQILSVILPIWNAPVWILQIVTITLAIGLPLWILFSWTYEFTTSGIKKTANASNATSQSLKTNKRLNAIIMIALIAVIVLIWINPSLVTSKTPSLRQGIAVLPFVNMSADDDNEWFGDGVTEDILTHLSKIKGLRVISRTSVLQYKGTTKTIPEICKELGVSHIVEGSVRQLNNKVLITAQLISATDEHLWADNYDDDLDNAFEVQRNVSKEIVKQLQITISPEEEQALNKSLTNNQDALQLYVKGRDLSDTNDTESIKNSIEPLKQAIALDPNFAAAYAEIANSVFLLTTYGAKPVEEAEMESRNWIDKALKIDPDNARAYGVLGFINIYKYVSVDRNPQFLYEAEKSFKQSIDLNPNDARVRHHYSMYLKLIPNPNFNDYFIQITEAGKLNPLSFLINNENILALISNKKYKEANSLLIEKKFLFPQELALTFLADIQSNLKKDWSEKIRILKEAQQKDPNNANLNLKLSQAYDGILNDDVNSLKYAQRAYELDSVSNTDIPYTYAIVLCENKQFKEAKDLINSAHFQDIMPEFQKLAALWDYYYYQEKYYEAKKVGTQISAIWDAQTVFSTFVDAQLGNRDELQDIFNDPDAVVAEKACVYAILKERDSMYYYMNKGDEYARWFNGRREFEPYRQEERFKAFLKKNYLPTLTDKSENR